MIFLDKQVLDTRVYPRAGLEINRKFRYVINRIADICVYDPIKVANKLFFKLVRKINTTTRKFLPMHGSYEPFQEQ